MDVVMLTHLVLIPTLAFTIPQFNSGLPPYDLLSKSGLPPGENYCYHILVLTNLFWNPDHLPIHTIYCNRCSKAQFFPHARATRSTESESGARTDVHKECVSAARGSVSVCPESRKACPVDTPDAFGYGNWQCMVWVSTRDTRGYYRLGCLIPVCAGIT